MKKPPRPVEVPQPLRGRLLALLLLAGAICYLNSLPGTIFWDSEVLILNNVFLRSFSYLSKIWTTSVMAGGGEITNYYRPLPVTLLLLEYQLWGAKALGYHVVSILLHLGAASLLFLWTEKLTRSRWSAFWAALLFTVHPIQNETVNYIDHFEGILALIFGLAALLLRRRGFRLCALAALGASLICKEEGAVFLPILALLELFRPSDDPKAQDSRPWIARLWSLWPEVMLFGAYVLLRLTAFNFLQLQPLEFGAQKGAYASLGLRLLTFAKALLTYFRLLALPVGLHFDRDMAPASAADPAAWGALLLAGFILLMLWRLSSKPGRWGILWFLAALLPYCGLVPFNNILAEHFLYIPCAGLFLTAALLGQRALASFPKPLAGAMLAALLGFYAAQNIRRNRDWQSPERIYISTLAGNPGSYRAANNLGAEFFRMSRLKEARAAFDAALRANPVYPPALNNIGAVEEAEGRLQEALEWYLKSGKAQPTYSLALKNASGLYLKLNRAADAQRLARDALAVQPEYAEAWQALGASLFNQGKKKEALEPLLKAASIAPTAEIYGNLALVYKSLGEKEKAEEARRRAQSQK
ncbi:MAG: tetratricopeptide repeat protein [Elusimicrobia bacterium]|nr:tetratricopeptide repeat protein [Elusimicrobiota bacterium]